jgi:flagellar hook-length control protein FliK
MRVPEKPGNGTAFSAAGSDRPQSLAGSQLSISSAFRFTSSDFARFLAGPAGALTSSSSVSSPPSQSADSRRPTSHRASSSDRSDVSSAPTVTTKPEEARSDEGEEDVVEDVQATLALAPVEAGIATADAVEESSMNAAAPSLADGDSGTEKRQNPEQDTASADSRTSTTANAKLSADDAGPSAEPKTLPSGGQLRANMSAVEDNDASTIVGPLSASEMGVERTDRGDSVQPDLVGNSSAALADELNDSPTSPAASQSPGRSGRRGGAGTSAARETAQNRRVHDAAGPREQPGATDRAAQQDAQQTGAAAFEAATAGPAEISGGSRADAVLPADPASAAAAAPVLDKAAQTALNATSGSETGVAGGLSSSDAADRIGDSVAGRQDAPTRTDIADRARLIHRITKALTKLGTDGGQVRMRMHPESLGSVLLEMRVLGRSVEARVTAENEASLSLLRQQLPDLRQRLESQGMTVQRLDVELRDENASDNSNPFNDPAGSGQWSEGENDGNRFGARQQSGSRHAGDAVEASRLGRNAAIAGEHHSRAGIGLERRTEPAAPGTLDLRL